MKANDKNKGWIGTILFHSAVLLVLMFLFGFKTPLPLPGENGVEVGTEVNLGNSEMGLGDFQPIELTDNSQSVSQSSSSSSDYLSQSTEDNPSLDNTSKNPNNKTDQINQNALYKGTNKNGTNQGVAGGTGDQGNPDGTVNSNNYNGITGTGGDISYDLTGRKSKNLIKPAYTSDDEGKIVVTVKVDKKGNVIYAKAGAKGTNIANTLLRKQCEAAALKSSFEAKTDAQIEQSGTISYIFLKLN
ncbi:MAG: hypothetical protein V1904_00140 [Bacteroidota bacterium]